MRIPLTLGLFVTAFICLSCDKLLDPNGQLLQGEGNFTGTWRAAKVTDTVSGAVRQCEDATIEINQTALQLTVDAHRFSCADGAYDVNFSTLQLAIDKGKLFYQGRPAGEIGSDFVDVDFTLNATKDWQLSIRTADKVLNYKEAMTGGSSLAGELSRTSF